MEQRSLDMNPTLITIDGGNTNLSVGIHRAHSQNKSHIEVLSWESYQKQFPQITDVPTLFSAVKTYPQVNKTQFPQLKLVPEFQTGQFLEMPVQYSKTIGIDRLVGAYYCFKEFQEQLEQGETICFVDAGTFLTIDFITAAGLQGGYIFPGLELLQKTYLAGENLAPPPLAPVPFPSQLPHSTEEAIQFAYSGLIDSILKLTKQTFCIVTGGNCEELAALIQQAQVDHLIQHKGLRHIANKIFSL